MSILPRELNFSELPNSLDSSVRSTTINILPSNNKSSFNPNDFIEFDFPKTSYIDPKSIYLSYKAAAVCGTTANTMLCTPFATPLNRIEESCRSGTLMLNSICQYNQLYNNLVSVKYSTADKYGAAPALGWKSSDDTNPKFDGRLLTASATNTWFMSGPLYGLIISNAEKFVSMEDLGGYKIKIYVEQLVNMFDNIAATTGVSSFTMSNVQLTLDVIDVSPEIQQMLKSQPYIIKSNTYATATQPIASNASGSLQLSFANNFSSLRHVLIQPYGSNSCKNGFFDAIDVTTSNSNASSATDPQGGSYQLSIGNIVYPQMPFNTGLNKAQVYQELKKACGLLYGNNNLSINAVEFNYGKATTSTTTVTEPAKFLLAVDTTRISALSNNLLNGVSTKNTPVNLLVNINTAVAEACNVTLCFNYDVLVNIDPINKQVSLSV